MAAADLTSQTFGRLRVLTRAPNAGRRARWLCLCECGKKVVVLAQNLRSGGTRSCGCRSSTTRGLARTHGHTRNGGRTRTYGRWRNMWDRCTNPNHPRFADWGGRGISVCERWRKYENFLADMGEVPGGPKGSADHHSLERIDNDGNYEPGNCRWATPKEQQANRRPRRS